jgi:hypothetical protein
LDRDDVDAAVAEVRVHELPSARGCTYVLPAEDFALGLTVGSGAPEADIASDGKFLGVTRTEIDELCEAVLTALEKASTPLDPAGIKAATGDAVRNLGEEGRNRGQSTTLPMALGLLQSRGEIRRVPVNGRIDQQRYGYVRWSPSPLSGTVRFGHREGRARETVLRLCCTGLAETLPLVLRSHRGGGEESRGATGFTSSGRH